MIGKEIGCVMEPAQKKQRREKAEIVEQHRRIVLILFLIETQFASIFEPIQAKQTSPQILHKLIYSKFINMSSSDRSNASSNSLSPEDQKKDSISLKSNENPGFIDRTFRAINLYKKNKKVTYSILFITLAIISLIAYSYFTKPPLLYDNVNFDYFYHCSAFDAFRHLVNLKKFKHLNQTISKLTDKYGTQLKRTYFAAAMSGQKINDNPSGPSPLKVRYCGFARKYNQTCATGKFICSSPGPAFDVNENEEIVVHWINNYKVFQKKQAYDQVQSFSSNKCFGADPLKNTVLCQKESRIQSKGNVWMFDPTDVFPSNITKCKYENVQKIVNSSRSSFPLSPHVHGLQVQPYYDGNPLSWFDNNGEVGVGNNPIKTKYILSQMFEIFQELKLTGSIKTNIYKNVQQPGTLWYHDHSMGVTSLNVRLGLQSFYIIRNKTSQKDLPSGQYEKMVLLYNNMFQDKPAYINCSRQCQNDFNNKDCEQCLRRNNGSTFLRTEPLKRSATYRFRILNGDFSNRFNNIHFKFSNCQGNQTQCSQSQILSFSVIGTDSSVFKVPVKDIDSVDLASAQRIDILLDIQPKIQKFTDNSKIIVQYNVSTTLAQFQIGASSGPKVQINELPLISFENLTHISQSQIAVKRMRPLVLSQPDRNFGINGHLRFHHGKSQNPKIGSVQDWYLINTISFGHPIHIHLIQYQVQEVVQLKVLGSCTYYLLDMVTNHAKYNQQNGYFVDPLMVSKSNNFTNKTGLCQYLQQVQNSTYIKFFQSFKNQDQIDKNRISGLNVQDVCQNQAQCQKEYGETNYGRNKFKYIDRTVDTSMWLKDYQRGWKETFYVPRYAYAKFRVRWTRTDFPLSLTKSLDPGNNPQGCKAGYFHISEEQITKSPGYVYHCHILSHQDKEMMRPIMVQPSGCTNLKPWRERWEQEYCKNIIHDTKQKGSGDLRVL